MRCLNVFILLGAIFFSACKSNKFSHPLTSLDFKSSNLKIVYVEDRSGLHSFESSWKFWLLEDQKIIESLKNEYACDLDRQCDGEKEYQIFTFNDHINSDWNLFCDKRSFSLGRLKRHMARVKTAYFECVSQYATKTVIDSLSKEGVYYTVTQNFPALKGKNPYSVILDLDVNPASKLFRNKDTLFNSWTPNAKLELERLFPEYTVEDISNLEFEERSQGFNIAPGYMPNPVGIMFLHKKLQFVLSKETPFILNAGRLKEIDLFRTYQIQIMNIVTAYIKVH